MKQVAIFLLERKSRSLLASRKNAGRKEKEPKAKLVLRTRLRAGGPPLGNFGERRPFLSGEIPAGP